MKKSRFTDRTKWKIIIVLMVGMVVVALFLQAGILMYVNSKNLDKTSQMLLDQSISIIEKNQKNEIDLIRSPTRNEVLMPPEAFDTKRYLMPSCCITRTGKVTCCIV